mmetsp:Transcript_102571/g.290087  ORF Transcript_102571/g.290087 Transcript_102571/m.290087 type:complete len:207 (+) Transcript_102571:317-937(+)
MIPHCHSQLARQDFGQLWQGTLLLVVWLLLQVRPVVPRRGPAAGPGPRPRPPGPPARPPPRASAAARRQGRPLRRPGSHGAPSPLRQPDSLRACPRAQQTGPPPLAQLRRPLACSRGATHQAPAGLPRGQQPPVMHECAPPGAPSRYEARPPTVLAACAAAAPRSQPWPELHRRRARSRRAAPELPPQQPRLAERPAGPASRPLAP